MPHGYILTLHFFREDRILPAWLYQNSCILYYQSHPVEVFYLILYASTVMAQWGVAMNPVKDAYYTHGKPDKDERGLDANKPGERNAKKQQ